MTGNDVIEFIQLLDDLHVHVWIDGGWAVNACLGSQTRPHADLDIVIEERDVDVVVRSLRERGFSDATREYAVDEDDWADVSALHARFGVPIPDNYAKFADARAGA